jgi:hypothetical protein
VATNNTFQAPPLTSLNQSTDVFGKSYSSYSGTDVNVIAQINNKLIVLGNLETFSYSIFREKSPVRVLGRSHCKGYTAGGRSIAGSMVFAVFDRAPLYDIIKELNYIRNPNDRRTSPVPDQLPPIDLILLFVNEYGFKSVMHLYGVEFVQEGQVHSINDLYSENTMQYVARDMDQLLSYSDLEEFKDMMFERQVRGLFVDNHLTAMLDYKKRIESQIQDTNNEIQRIQSLGVIIDQNGNIVSPEYINAETVNQGFAGWIETTPTEREAEQKIEKQLKIKNYLLKELEKTNNQIRLYEQGMTGWNAQRGDTGIAQNDYLGHAPKY